VKRLHYENVQVLMCCIILARERKERVNETKYIDHFFSLNSEVINYIFDELQLREQKIKCTQEMKLIRLIK